jgi:D-hexose-6-phosphate mutarotase
MTTSTIQHDPEGRSPGRVAFLDGQNELPMIEIATAWSTAELYLHGAHVTQFRKRDEPPLLFMSQCSRFTENQPIRGGIPVIFPWFGPREGLPQHGFARLKTWDLKELLPAADGSVSLRFRLPDYPEASTLAPFTADYVVSVKDTLTLELIITNCSADEVLNFEGCLHTYFEVGDCTAISIRGLKGVSYLDRVDNFARKVQTGEVIKIGAEVDRTFLDATGPVEILDPVFGRRIRVEKQGSASTVVWNPWIAKSQQMPDFGNEEYKHMVCVESGNVAANEIKLPPGQSQTLTVTLSSAPLGSGE